MKAFVTGATGFIGGRLAGRLVERGDEVVALVRSPDRAVALRAIGCELVEGDLSEPDVLTSAMSGSDAVFHVAAAYEVGIPDSERPAMYEANVRGTERVFDAAVAARVPKIVYVSTIGVFGNTHGRIVDESYRHPGEDFLTYYEETKAEAHEIALDRIARGVPVVIVQPGGVYGPGDHSALGDLIERVRSGRLRFLVFASSGFNFVHLDDVVEGMLLAHDKGVVGESYVLGGEIGTIGDVTRKVAELSGRTPPRRELPSFLLKAMIPLGPVLGPRMGFPSNLGEAIRAAEGVTYWATDDKARGELGYAPRDLDTGLRELLAVQK